MPINYKDTVSSDWIDKKLGPLKFGTLVATMREHLEMTQAQFGKKFGVSRQMVCDIEKSRVTVSLNMAIKIANAAQWPLPYVLVRYFDDQIRRAKLNYTVKVEEPSRKSA